LGIEGVEEYWRCVAKRFLGALDADTTAGKSNLDKFEKFAVASRARNRTFALVTAPTSLPADWSVGGAIRVRYSRKLL
jgi:hypothetical protein